MPKKLTLEELSTLSSIKLVPSLANHYFLEDKALTENKDFMLKVVSLNGMALKHASDKLKNDKHVVFAAIEQNPQALQFASEELKNDPTFKLAADIVSKAKSIDSQDSKELKQSINVEWNNSRSQEQKQIKVMDSLLMAAIHSPFVLEYAPDALKKDRIFNLAAKYINKDLANIRVSPYGPWNQYNTQALYIAVEHSSDAMQDAPKEIKENEFVMLGAIMINPETVKHAGDKLKQSEMFKLAVMLVDINAAKILQKIDIVDVEGIKGYVQEQYNQKPEIVKTSFLLAVQYNLDAMQYAPKALLQDKEFQEELREANSDIANTSKSFTYAKVTGLVTMALLIVAIAVTIAAPPLGLGMAALWIAPTLTGVSSAGFGYKGYLENRQATADDSLDSVSRIHPTIPSAELVSSKGSTTAATGEARVPLGDTRPSNMTGGNATDRNQPTN